MNQTCTIVFEPDAETGHHRHHPNQYCPTSRISDLAGRRSVLLFQRFRFTIDDVQFLRRAQRQWCKSDSYQRPERLVFNIKVTNDTAERGIKILEDYKDVLTTHNEQRNMILHCVESIRQKYPDFRKKTLSC